MSSVRDSTHNTSFKKRNYYFMQFDAIAEFIGRYICDCHTYFTVILRVTEFAKIIGAQQANVVLKGHGRKTTLVLYIGRGISASDLVSNLQGPSSTAN